MARIYGRLSAFRPRSSTIITGLCHFSNFLTARLFCFESLLLFFSPLSLRIVSLSIFYTQDGLFTNRPLLLIFERTGDASFPVRCASLVPFVERLWGRPSMRYISRALSSLGRDLCWRPVISIRWSQSQVIGYRTRWLASLFLGFFILSSTWQMAVYWPETKSALDSKLWKSKFNAFRTWSYLAEDQLEERTKRPYRQFKLGLIHRIVFNSLFGTKKNLDNERLFGSSGVFLEWFELRSFRQLLAMNFSGRWS